MLHADALGPIEVSELKLSEKSHGPRATANVTLPDIGEMKIIGCQVMTQRGGALWVRFPSYRVVGGHIVEAVGFGHRKSAQRIKHAVLEAYQAAKLELCEQRYEALAKPTAEPSPNLA